MPYSSEQLQALSDEQLDAYIKRKQQAITVRPHTGAPPAESTTDEAESGVLPAAKRAGKQVLETIENIPKSAGRYVGDIAQTIRHPIDTATTFMNLGRGVMQKLGILQGTQYEVYPEAVGKMIADRYGSPGAAFKTLHDDPVGMAADISMMFGGAGLVPRALGEGAQIAGATRTAGVLGKTADVLGAVSEVTDPVAGARKAGDFAARWGGEIPAQFFGRTMTHTGEESMRIPAKAGYEAAGRSAFLKQVVGYGQPMQDLVVEARAGLNAMRKAKSAAYNSDKARVLLDKTVLDFKDIDKAVSDTEKSFSFKQLPPPETSGDILNHIKRYIASYKLLPDKEYHTAEGLDAMKKRLRASVIKKFGELKEGTPEAKVLGDIYASVKDTIINQAPEYGKMMLAYDEADDLIKDIEKTLSLNRHAAVDTSLRKLLSVLRDNVSTNYGHRRELMKYLVDAGATNIMQKLAGEQMRTLLPRGLGGAIYGAANIAGGSAAAAHVKGALPAWLMYTAGSSPALAGLGALGAGTAARYAGKASHAAPHARMLGKIGARQAPDGSYYIQGEDGTHYRVDVDDGASGQTPTPPISQ